MGRIFTPGPQTPADAQVIPVSLSLGVSPDGRILVITSIGQAISMCAPITTEEAKGMVVNMMKLIKQLEGPPIDLGVNGDGSVKGLGQE